MHLNKLYHCNILRHNYSHEEQPAPSISSSSPGREIFQEENLFLYSVVGYPDTDIVLKQRKDISIFVHSTGACWCIGPERVSISEAAIVHYTGNWFVGLLNGSSETIRFGCRRPIQLACKLICMFIGRIFGCDSIWALIGHTISMWIGTMIYWLNSQGLCSLNGKTSLLPPDIVKSRTGDVAMLQFWYPISPLREYVRSGV